MGHAITSPSSVAFCVAACAYADSVSTFNITQATVFVGPGSDNAGFILTGPGTEISGFGGYGCQLDWCDGQIFPPGSVPPLRLANGQIFLGGFDIVRIGGHDFSPDASGLSGLAFDILGGFTFPKNPTGSSFTACVSATMPGSISGSASDDTFIQFNLNMPPGGKFCSTWDFVPASDEFPAGYQFSHGKFLAATIPEPGTFGFMATGLAGIIGVIRRKRNCRSPVTR